MTNSTRCALLAKQACTTLSHVVQKITPPSANNFLKLFFALFAMLALNVGNAWGAEETITLSDFGWSNASVQSSISATTATITLQQNSAGTAPTYYDSDGLRLYGVSNATTGGTISFTPKKGITISKIVFTHGIKNSGVLAIKTGEGSYSSSTKTWSGTLTEGNTVSLVSTNSSSGNPQVKITKIVITYETSGSTEPALSVVTVSGTPTKTIYETGEVFVPTGLTVTGTYGTGAETTQQEITSGITWTANNGSEYVALENVPLTQGQTSIQVKATVNEITSEAYTANITVNAAPTKITFLASQLGGTNNKYELKEGSASGVTYIAYSYKKGEGENFQFNGTDGKTNIFYNTSAMPGAITILKAVKASGTDRSVTPYVSTAPLTKDNYSTAGIALSAKNVVEGGTIWTISEESSLTAEQKSAEYKYFYFHYSTSSALYVSKFEVAYKEVAGGDEGGTEEPVLSVTPENITWEGVAASAEKSEEITVTLSNIETVIAELSGDNPTAFSIDKELLEASGKIIVSKNTTTIGDYAAILTITDTDTQTKTIALSMEVVADPEPTGTFAKFTGTIEEGDYVLVANETTDALKNTITDDRFDCGTVEVAEDKIVNPDKSVIWHIAANGTYWTMYNESATKYAGGTTSKNEGALLDDVTDLAKWTITVDGEGVYTFENYGRSLQSSNAGNKFLSKNSQYQYWATYASGQKNPVLYKKSDGKQPAGLVYETNKYRTKLGDVFATPALTNPNSLNVTYSSSNNDVAEVATDGSVTIKAVGGVEITATFAGSETHRQGFATYTICVTDHAGTQADPYTVADARRVIDVMGTATDVYATGIVSEIVTDYNEQYGNISYNISADGLTTSDQLQAYRGKGVNGVNFTSDDDVKVGDEVVIKGTLKKFSTTYEFDENNQLVSLNRTKEQAGLAYAETEHNANVGEDFAEPELTNPNGLSVEYSTSDATLATVNASTGDVTIGSKAGTVTITASFAGNENYVAGEASYTITITDPALAIATLPFEFNGGLNDIVSTAGITQEGLGSDYTSDNAQNSKLKFDHTGDYIIIHFDTKPDKLMYNIKNNDFEDGTFSVQESVDGEIYSTLCTYQKTFTNAPSALHTLQATSRYVKFIYTEKVRGNVGLGNIQITKLDTRQEAGLEWSTTSYNTYDGDETLAPTLTNPYGLNITYSSSNEDVATIDGAGKLTLKNTGITTITATFAGNENYKEAEVSYTLSYASKWALTYTSNVKVGTNIVKINDTEYEAIKTGTGSAYGSTTVVVPVSTHTLHFHAAGWGNDEDVKLIVKNGETELGTFILSKDAGVKENSPYTLQGTPYLQYYSVALTNITTETEITFEASTSGEGKRFVLYGVNQEGGVLPELNRIAIAGEATELTYEVGDVFNPAGLSVNAIYTLAGVDHETVAIDAEDVEWSFNPATIAAETSQVEVTATYMEKTATKTVAGLTVNVPTPEITVSPTSIDWGTVAKDSEASKEVTVTLKAVANATISISGTNPSTFSVDKTALTETGTIVVSANTSSVGTFTATLTISDDAAAAEEKKISLKIIVEGIDDVYGNWQLVTDASTLKAGDMVIVASVEVEGKYYTMGKQNSNNRAAIESTVSETQLTPTTGTSVLTLVDAGDGKFAFQASNGKYLSAAGTGTSNYLREAENYDSDKTKWTISVTAEGIATIQATSDNRNLMRYNPNNGSPLFSCYGSGQKDIALYKRVPDYTRTGLSQGAYGTICLSNNIEALFGATLYTVAGKETNGRVVFDEVPISETEAGKPYIFLAESSHIEVYYGTETATEAGKHNSLQGTFNQIDPAVDNILVGNYMVVNNVIKKCGINCGLQANRAYFVATELDNLGAAPQPMPGRRRVTMGVTGENGTTDLDNITTTDTPVKVIENGQLIIIRDGVKYNVQGVRL